MFLFTISLSEKSTHVLTFGQNWNERQSVEDVEQCCAHISSDVTDANDWSEANIGIVPEWSKYSSR